MMKTSGVGLVIPYRPERPASCVRRASSSRFPEMRAFLAVALLALVGCSRPLPPAAPAPRVTSGPPPRDVGPLVALGYTEDRVCYCATVVRPDGDVDYAFRVRISGDVRALALYASDAAGVQQGMEVWDTITDKFPPAWHMPVPADISYALGVIDSNKRVLNPNGVLDQRSFNNEELTIFVADQGNLRFASGRTYSLLVVRNDGKTDRATTTVL